MPSVAVTVEEDESVASEVSLLTTLIVSPAAGSSFISNVNARVSTSPSANVLSATPSEFCKDAPRREVPDVSSVVVPSDN